MDRPVAWITGATGVLGEAVCRTFAAEGFALGLWRHQNAEKQRALVIWLEGNFPETPFKWCDTPFTEAEALHAACRSLKQTLGPVTVLVHCAGNIIRKRLEKQSDADYEEVMNVHLNGARLMAREAIRQMLPRREGHCLFTGSFQGLCGGEGITPYATAKAALSGLVISLAKEYGPQNIQCNLVLPGFMESALSRDTPDAMRQRMLQQHCLPHTSDPAEVARFMHFLTTLRRVSGQTFNLDSRILRSF